MGDKAMATTPMLSRVAVGQGRVSDPGRANIRVVKFSAA